MAATPAQRHRALRLYRHSLKQLLSWFSHREHFKQALERTRDAFESNRYLETPQQVERELSKGEEHLRNNLHPEPITVPEGYSYAGPGSKYARNPPVPPEVTIVYDWNRGQGYIPDTSSDSSR